MHDSSCRIDTHVRQSCRQYYEVRYKQARKFVYIGPFFCVSMNKSLYFGFLAYLFLIGLHAYSYRDVPIRIWDEAIYANNALEMTETGNLLVLHNNGEPSLYNTKPPLNIWLQA